MGDEVAVLLVGETVCVAFLVCSLVMPDGVGVLGVVGLEAAEVDVLVGVGSGLVVRPVVTAALPEAGLDEADDEDG